MLQKPDASAYMTSRNPAHQNDGGELSVAELKREQARNSKPEVAKKPYQLLMVRATVCCRRLPSSRSTPAARLLRSGSPVGWGVVVAEAGVCACVCAWQVSILREYLALEMKVDNLGFTYDPERIYDDFVFMCFFVGAHAPVPRTRARTRPGERVLGRGHW